MGCQEIYSYIYVKKDFAWTFYKMARDVNVMLNVTHNVCTIKNMLHIYVHGIYIYIHLYFTKVNINS